MFWTVTQSLFDALGQTAEIFFLTLLFGLPLGLVVAFGSMSKWQPFRFLLQPKKRKGSGTPTAETDLAPVKQEPSFGPSIPSPTWWCGSSGAPP